MLAAAGKRAYSAYSQRNTACCSQTNADIVAKTMSCKILKYIQTCKITAALGMKHFTTNTWLVYGYFCVYSRTPKNSFFASSCISSSLSLSHTKLNPLANRAFASSVIFFYATALPNHHRITLRSQSTISHHAQQLCTKEYALRPTETDNVLCFAYAGQNSI